MSFEFKGAIIARDLIISKGGHGDQADSVCEAIVRHQDIFVKGFVVSPSLVLIEDGELDGVFSLGKYLEDWIWVFSRKGRNLMSFEIILRHR